MSLRNVLIFNHGVEIVKKMFLALLILGTSNLAMASTYICKGKSFGSELDSTVTVAANELRIITEGKSEGDVVEKQYCQVNADGSCSANVVSNPYSWSGFTYVYTFSPSPFSGNVEQFRMVSKIADTVYRDSVCELQN
jgi:hypothetical protein